MNNDRLNQTLGATLAALWLVALIAIDLTIPGTTVVLSPLFALAPLIACAVLPARATAVVAAAAVAATVASGWWNNTASTPQHLVRIAEQLLIGTAAIVIAAVRVRREQRHQRVVAIAEVAQRTILPTLPNLIGQVTLAARYQSAAQDAVVGGDLYDCYHYAGRARFIVGDVRGKGITAVEQAARVIRAFRQSAGTTNTLPELAHDMSEYLAPFFDDEEFVTALLVDTSRPRRITIASCGHPPALLAHPDGTTALLDAPPGLPLGLGETYDAITVPWDPGDRLLMYTDGLSEARNARGEFLDVPSLGPLLTRVPVEEALNAVLHAVRQHIPGGHLTDDLAVMLLENTSITKTTSVDPTANSTKASRIPLTSPALHPETPTRS